MERDSSDEEEDEVISYTGEKLQERLTAFNEQRERSRDFGHNNLSFITHAVAIKFLYSPTIQSAYYAKKNHESTPRFNQESFDIPKKFLDLSGTTAENFWVEFFSSLRLYNRLEKRRVKYRNEDERKESEWTYSTKAKFKVEHGIKCMTKKMRFEEVMFLLNGADICAPYKQIYNDLPLTMQDSKEVADTFTNGPSRLSSNAAILHYLLFGTEVMRNPSALIHNMMMLDLIAKGQLTWEDAFVNNVMPMSIVGAINASRIQNSEYNENFMPHKYLYEHRTYEEYSNNWHPDYKEKIDKENYDAAKTLLEKQQILIKKWLKMKLGGSFTNIMLSNDGDLKMKFVVEIFEIIQTHEWGTRLNESSF